MIVGFQKARRPSRIDAATAGGFYDGRMMRFDVRENMTMPITLFHRGLLGLLALGLYAGPAPAQAPADFYKGQTVTIILSSAPGGGYDAVARTLAMHLPKHIPGSPTVVVKNMAGAGGIVAANFLYNVAPKDGLTIGGLQNNVPFEPLYGTKEANFDPTKFNWLGTPSYETAVLTVWHTSPVTNWEGARTTELTMGSSGNNSTPSFYGRLLNEVLGLKLKIIVGYESQTHAFLAMEREEINGYPSVFYNSLSATKPTWLPEKKVKLLVQMGGQKEKDIADVPLLSDLVTKAEDKALVEAAIGPLTAGRPYLMPPGVPADRVEIMRKAFAETFKDPDFLAEAEKRKLGVNAPRDGKQLQEVIERVYKGTPPALVERLRKLQHG
jgi:tripartite-type tricarboxylate transporter receptor subunit TctC